MPNAIAVVGKEGLDADRRPIIEAVVDADIDKMYLIHASDG